MTSRVLPFGVAVVACLAVIAAGFTPAHGETPPEHIAEVIAEAAQVCRAAGGKPDTAAILSAEDLNGDGQSDWMADFAKLRCEGADNPICNPNGCTLQLYFGNADGWDLVFEDFAKSHKFSTSGKTRMMHVTTSGVTCNKPAEQTCNYNYRLGKDAVVPVQ